MISRACRARLLDVITARLGFINDDDFAARMETLSTEIDETHFGWWGPQDALGTAFSGCPARHWCSNTRLSRKLRKRNEVTAGAAFVQGRRGLGRRRTRAPRSEARVRRRGAQNGTD